MGQEHLLFLLWVWLGLEGSEKRARQKTRGKSLSPVIQISKAIKGVGSWWVSSGYPQEGSGWAYRTRCPNNVLWFRRVRKDGELVRTMATNRKVWTSCWRIDLRALLRGQNWIQVKTVLFMLAVLGMGPKVLPLFEVGQIRLLWLAQGTRQEECELLAGAFGMFQPCWCLELEAKGNLVRRGTGQNILRSSQAKGKLCQAWVSLPSLSVFFCPGSQLAQGWSGCTVRAAMAGPLRLGRLRAHSWASAGQGTASFVWLKQFPWFQHHFWSLQHFF